MIGFGVSDCRKMLQATTELLTRHAHLGRVVPLCALNGSVATGGPWTVVSSVHHVDWLPLIKQVVCSGSFG